MLHAESVIGTIPRLLFRVAMPPDSMQVIRIDRQGGPMTVENLVRAEDCFLASDKGATVSLAAEKGLNIGGVRMALPRLELIEDRSDTWAHGVERFPDGPVTSAQWNDPWVAGDRGPLMAAIFQTGRIGHTGLKAEWRVYAGEPFVELRLDVHWCEAFKLLRLVLPLPAESPDRRDGIPGGSLVRPNSSVERPLADWTLCGAVGVVSPDVYAVEGAPARLRFTLLRSPAMTQGLDPDRDNVLSRAHIADQGEHTFRLRFFAGSGVTAKLLEDHALMLHRPILAADLTRGMPKRYD
jgi:alpha-mannosidase